MASNANVEQPEEEEVSNIQPGNRLTAGGSELHHNPSDEEEENMIEDQFEIVGDATEICDDEALNYIIGSLIRRHSCSECDIGKLGDLDAPNFTQAMTYRNAQLYTPSSTLFNNLKLKLPSITNFFHQNLHQPHLTVIALSHFRLVAPEFGFCTQRHADSFVQLFLKLILRAMCKNINKQFAEAKRKMGEEKKKN